MAQPRQEVPEWLRFIDKRKTQMEIELGKKEFKPVEEVYERVLNELKLELKELTNLKEIEDGLKEIKLYIEKLHEDIMRLKAIKEKEQELVNAGYTPSKGWEGVSNRDEFMQMESKLNFIRRDGIRKIEEIGRKLTIIKELLSRISEEERQGTAVKDKINLLVNAASGSLRLYAKHLRTPFFRHHEDLDEALTWVPRKVKIPIRAGQ